MKRLFVRSLLLLVYLYVGLAALWFLLHLALGDGPWWLTRANSFTPFLFAPLLLLLPVGLFYHRRSFWLAVLIPSLLFLFLYGRLFLPNWPSPQVTEEAPITVMSFNIWGYSQEAAAAQVILDNGPPDLVVLQELSPAMTQRLVQDLGEIYPYRALHPAARL
jgi:endonuclease/exonuclease/phosphatase (EEP) superfamily protein YafD